MTYTGAHPPFDEDVDDADLPIRKLNRERSRRNEARSKRADPERTSQPRVRKPDGSETFRCRHCRTMVGPTLSGGRHRNHCPVCLHSLHVDGKTPGDRASNCRSVMAPIGLFARPSGEQVIVHQCLGCGFQRFNRVAADDSPFIVMRLALVEPLTAQTETAASDLLASR